MLGMLPILGGRTLAQSVSPAAQSATAQETAVKARKSAGEISYEVKLPVGMHTEQVSDELANLTAAEPIGVKWETKKETK